MRPATANQVGLLTSFIALAYCGTRLARWLLFGRTKTSRHGAPGCDDAGQDIHESLIQHNSGGGSGSTKGACASSPATDAIHPWLSEVMLLRGLRHKNIINLVRAAAVQSRSSGAGNEFELAYEHTENGSLDEWLHLLPVPEGEPRRPRTPLSWPMRRGIAIGVAGGLCYLHRRRLIHHNINSSSILLDGAFEPKIAGFGFAQHMDTGGPDDQQAQPTPLLPSWNFGYTAPDYVTMIGELTEKVDVYSFGVVLLELVTGRVANESAVIEDGRGVVVNRYSRLGRLARHLPTWAGRVMDNRAGFNSNVVDQLIPDKARYMREMAAAFMLGVHCTDMLAPKRPPMKDVLRRLRNHGSALSWIKHRLLCCRVL